jgi:NAD(P)H-binding
MRSSCCLPYRRTSTCLWGTIAISIFFQGIFSSSSSDLSSSSSSSSLLFATALSSVSSTSTTTSSATLPKKVAVIGTTGRLGRQAIVQLSQQGVATRCLLRQDPKSLSTTTIPSSLNEATTSAQVAAYLQSLPGVELVQGDVTNQASLATLLQGTTACLALHGAGPPKPFIKSLLFPQIFYPETDRSHPRQVNYEGIQCLLNVMNNKACTCQHLVRITGKGETPWSIFSILINALGGVAKGWNYEGEQLIRTTCTTKSGLHYTIIRPGVMKDTAAVESSSSKNANNGEATLILGVADNGGDLPVTAVSYTDIANLAIAVTDSNRPNCQRSTLTAMMVDSTNQVNNLYSLDAVQPDSRTFPASLIQEHKKAARVGGLVLLTILSTLAVTVLSILRQVLLPLLQRLF